MPVVTCPSCTARTKIPAQVTAFKCPKCGAKIDTEPEEEIIVAELVTPARRKRPADDDDSWDDEPRPQRRRRDYDDYPRRGGTVTIQATGKLWKAIAALGALTLIGGIIWGCTGLQLREPGADVVKIIVSPLLLSFGGLIVYMVGRVGAWWMHE